MMFQTNPFTASTKYADKKVHLGVSGSVACYKAAELLRTLLKMQIRVSATLSDGARHFVTPMLFEALGADPVYGEMFTDANIFAHLEPGRNVQAMAIVPASANMLAKLAQGAASDMLSAQALAFKGQLLLAPAMNPHMWANPATIANVQTLAQRGAVIMEPGTGAAACGEVGKGRLADLPEIFLEILKSLSSQDMRGIKVMVTLGPTREPWDGVRFLSNPSSGRMGASLATCAWLRGADVWAIIGPGVSSYLPSSIAIERVHTAREMFTAASDLWPQMDFGVFCAAVSDFSPVRPENADNLKIKKDRGAPPVIELKQNPDILQTLSHNRKPNQKVLGFAAEAVPEIKDLEPLALGKLAKKNADLLAANQVTGQAGAFGSESGSMFVVDRNGVSETWLGQSKADIAWELLTWLLKI